MATDPEWQGPLPQAAGVVASSAPMSGIDTVIAWGSVAAVVAGGVFVFTGSAARRASVGLPLLVVGGFGAWYAFGRKVDATENLDGLRAQTRAKAASTTRTPSLTLAPMTSAAERGRWDFWVDSQSRTGQTATAAGWQRGRDMADYADAYFGDNV